MTLSFKRIAGIGSVAALILVAPIQAQAAPQMPIEGVTASADFGGTGNLQSTVNGGYLSSFSLKATDLTAYYDDTSNIWTGSLAVGNGGAETVSYSFPGEESIDEIAFWNYNADSDFNSYFGIKDVSFSYSTDGVNYIPLPGAPTVFAMAAEETYDSPQIFSFTAVDAVSVKMSYTETFSSALYDDYVGGYNAILFASGAPEIDSQSAALPLVLCIGSLLMFERRKRRAQPSLV